MKNSKEKDDFPTQVGQKRFSQWKKTALSKADLSRKGSIDEPLVEWVNLVNNHPGLYTTSCCSGRIAIVNQPGMAQVQKEGLEWIHMTHQKISDETEIVEIREKIKNRINDANDELSTIIFKFEGAIAHFCVENLKLAKQLFDTSRLAGFRNSGISIGSNAKFTVQIRGTNSIEVPLSAGNKFLINDDYFKYLVETANEKFEKNLKCIQKLENLFRKELLVTSSS